MDVSTAATFFDLQPVYDSYSPTVLLFKGQPDLYDSSERDSPTGFRRTVSAEAVTVPARGCVRIGDTNFVAGRVIKDYFQGDPIRQTLLLHPADGLLNIDTANVFLVAGTLSKMYAAVSWSRDKRVVETTSESYPIYDVYFSSTETIVVGTIIQGTDGSYFRVEAVSTRSGGIRVAAAYELGTAALRTLSYIPAGTTYNPVTDTNGTQTPIPLKAFVETFYSNYHMITNGAASFEPADLVITILKADVTAPKTGDTITDGARSYRVVDKQGSGITWLIHARPV